MSSPPPATTIPERYIRFGKACFAVVAALGLIAWIGWGAGIETMHSLVPEWSSMKPVTAACIVLLGLAGYLVADARPRQPVWLAPACAGLALLGGLQTVVANVFGVDFGIDDALMPSAALSAATSPHPGRMAHLTAVVIMLIGAGILLGHAASRRRQLAAQVPSVLGLVASSTALIGYLYGVESLYSMSADSSMAPDTAVLCLLLSLGLLAARPTVGFMETVTSEHLGGTMARRMLPLAVALPTFLGWLRLMGQRADLYSTEFGLAIFAMSNIVIFAALTIGTARTLNRVGMAHEDANLRFHLAVEGAPNAMIMIDVDGMIRLCNHRAEQLFGYDRNELLDRPVEILVPESVRAGHVAHRTGYHVHPEERPMGSGRELFGVRKDGRVIPLEVGLNPIGSPSGQYVLAGIVDVTERKRAADLLQQSEARFRLVAENIQEVFWITSVDKSQLIYVSPAYESIWGRSLESLHAEPASWLHAIHEDDRPRVMRAATERQAKGTYDEEYRIVRPDGSIRWIRDRAYPIRDGNGDVERIVGVAIDMTQNHKLEDQLRESQKMEAVGQLAGGIAHDFNNLLSVINGNAQLALGELSRNHPAATCLREIERAGSRATDLVRRILTFSRQEVQDRRVMKMQPVVEEAVKFMRAILPGMIEIRTSIEPDLPSVLIDPVQIHQVIMNLGTNAAHAMNERGVLEIRLARIVVDEELTRGYPELRPGEHVRLTVSDDGSGMDAATQQRIFEPFFTTKPQGTGTGLGLAVVHGIVRSHDATITVYSTPDVGTTFRIYFPAVQDDAGEAEADTAAPVRGDGQHVMYVDDEGALVSLVTRMLEALGYKVSGFTSAEAALQEFAARPDEYDLLVTDLSMPGMSGIEVAERLLRIRPDLPVIVTSGYVRPSDESRALAIGVKAMLLKPNTIRELGTMLHQVFSALR